MEVNSMAITLIIAMLSLRPKAPDKGLNNEIKSFINQVNKYKSWTIVHSDLPYLTKHFARTWISLCTSKDIVIAASKDNGTPIIGGTKFFNNFFTYFMKFYLCKVVNSILSHLH